jgi:hypothetical protein
MPGFWIEPRDHGGDAIHHRHGSVHRSANLFVINSLMRFANYSRWPCWAMQVR